MKGRSVGAIIVLLVAAEVLRALGQDPSANQYHDMANKAKRAGDLQGEASYLCKAATLDRKYQKKCDRAQQIANSALLQFHLDLTVAQTEIQHEDYPGAIRDLKKITFGSDRDEAQRLMVEAQKRVNGLSAEVIDRQAMKAAHMAYLEGDFNSAVNFASNVKSESLQADAWQLLTNIRIYRDTMAQAEVMERNGDYRNAEEKYQFAVTIHANGPGQPRQRLRDVEDAEMKTAKNKEEEQAMAQRSGHANSSSLDKSQASENLVLAKKTRLLQTARQTEAKGNTKRALASHGTALSLGIQQADAMADHASVQSLTQSEASVVKSQLESGIAAFYVSRFGEADDAFRAYLETGGKLYAGASHFYLGASLLTQAILAPPEARIALRQEAQREFELASQLNYRPVESAVSPKILAQWAQVDSQH